MAITLKQKQFSGDVNTVDEALKLSGMDFIAEQSELLNVATGVVSPTHKAIYNGSNDKQLGIVGHTYEPVQNTDAFAFFDLICKAYKAKFELGYNINNGAKCVLQAKIPGSFEPRKGDKVDQYFTLINGFDGKSGVQAYFTPIRLFCMNQLNASIKKAENRVLLRHTKNVKARMEEAFEIFGMGVEFFEQFKVLSTELAQKMVDAKMVEKFLNGVMGETKSTQIKNKKNRVEELFVSGKGNKGESLWDLYNGYTEYIDHFSTANKNRLLVNATIGSGVDKKEKAFKVATSLLG